MPNRFREHGVGSYTIDLLDRWVEYRLRSIIHGAFMPQDSKRYIFLKSRNKHGQVIFNVQILEGLDFVKSTAPKKWNDLDEFSYAFYDLDRVDQILILSWTDPFGELDDMAQWKQYLKQFGISRNHDNLLAEALVKLQYLCQQRGIIKIMADDSTMRGWKEIANYLRVSIPTAMRLCIDFKAPITIFGGTALTTREKLDQWLEIQIDTNPYYIQRGKK